MNQKKKIYCISGLGADERVFSHIQFPAGYDVHFLPWITPMYDDEPIEEYAARMSKDIDTTEPVSLVGLSFGGIMSIEIARQIKVDKMVLLSTIKNSKERPPIFNRFTTFVFKRLPDKLIFKNRAFFVKLFLQSKSHEENKLVADYLKKDDYTYLRWAVGTIMQWKNDDELQQPFIHIHGDKDRPFPIKYVHPTHILHGAGHFMVMNRSKEINHILAGFL
ncbi:pimeloyl-ACP methyl ester carboxylesterase [Chitinophaga skermanii]|uniref:Pimeloyl-ACP methyl ester carboxylesterase n=1 Tax=Chitinophaga skermanii TaxID=331697 RepID=A0A327QN35_9BACT|nr:alpha/beta hydrolase [Chitinophaga skermanii]RAJ05062.1 pimeloyl-ACP methyl ester carboxylesterase [Chitinophaga skermanii]